jgi:acyl carrier protein
VASDITIRIQSFLQQRFQDHTFEPDEEIFGTGRVNSLFAMQLVLFVEKEFGVQVGDEDLSLENFRTIRAMDRMVSRKRAA